MKIEIQSPGFTPKQDLLEFVHNEVSKVESLYEEIISMEVCLSLHNSSTNENKNCRLRLVIPGNDLLSLAESTTFEEATRRSVEIIKRQIEKIKTKRRRRYAIKSIGHGRL
jgi:putative sigma-54 modulation protein